MIVYFHKLYYSLYNCHCLYCAYYNIPSIEMSIHVLYEEGEKNPVVDILLGRVIDIIKRYRWPIYKNKKIREKG